MLSTLNHLAPMGFVALGFTLGMRHSTDPDHVIAVTAILTRERGIGAASRTGLIWGLGHSVTVLLVGFAIIFLRIQIPVRLGLMMEFAVALVLIVLGLPAAATVTRRMNGWLRAPAVVGVGQVHAHLHAHLGASHSHVHAHEDGADASHHSHLFQHADALAPQARPALKSFGVGLVHGLAGSAAIALVVLSAIPQPVWAVMYLAVFCTGVIAGMVLITTAIGAPMVLAADRVAQVHRGLVVGSGLLSLCFGLFIAYQIGIADGLFSAAPIWTPH
jgi:high-affinity nickel permease